MTDKTNRRKIRQFLITWSQRQSPTPLGVIQAAALERFAPDPTFVEAFLPVAVGCDPFLTKAILAKPLAAMVVDGMRVLQAQPLHRFLLEDDRWSRQPGGSGPERLS